MDEMLNGKFAAGSNNGHRKQRLRVLIREEKLFEVHSKKRGPSATSEVCGVVTSLAKSGGSPSKVVECLCCVACAAFWLGGFGWAAHACLARRRSE